MLSFPQTLNALALATLLAGPAMAQQTTPSTNSSTATRRAARRAARAAATRPVPTASPAAPANGAGAAHGPHGKGGPHGGKDSPHDMGPHKGPHGKGGPHEARTLQPVQSLSGTVTRYVSNPEGFYDGFVLPLNGTETIVHFPLHMAKAVMAAARPGQRISFGAVPRRAGHQAPAATATPTATAPTATATAAARLELVSVQNGSTPLLVQPPARPATPAAAPVATTVSGRIVERRTDDRGQLRGLVLTDNTLLLIPPHVGAQLGDKLKVDETVQATGTVMPLREGMVAATDVRRFQALTLTVGGVQFLVR